MAETADDSESSGYQLEHCRQNNTKLTSHASASGKKTFVAGEPDLVFYLYTHHGDVSCSSSSVGRLLPLLLTALGEKSSAAAAAIAIRDLCESCGKHMAPCLNELSGLYQKTLEAGAATKAAQAAAAAAAATGPVGGPVLTASQRSAAGSAAAAAVKDAAAAAGGLHEDDVCCVIQGVVACLSR